MTPPAQRAGHARSAGPDLGADERRVRPALLALALGGFAIGTTEFVTMGLLPQIAAGVHISIPTAGHVVSSYALGVVVGAPLVATVGGVVIALAGAVLQRREAGRHTPDA